MAGTSGQNYNIKVYRSRFKLTDRELGEAALGRGWGGREELRERLGPCSTKKSGYEEKIMAMVEETAVESNPV